MARTLVKEIKDLRKNYIINGNFDFWQRGTTKTLSGTGLQSGYIADRFQLVSNGPTSKNFTVSRDTIVPTFAQSNVTSTYSCKFTNTTTIASLNTTDLFLPFCYWIEGRDYKELHNGQPITLSFWFKSSVTGNYCVSFRNSADNKHYLAEFVVSTTNWEKKSIIINTDITGTWVFDTGGGIRIDIASLGGSTYQGTANSWLGGTYYSTSSTTNYAATTSTINLAQVQLNFGSIAAAFSLFGNNYQGELAACQRYYEKSYDVITTPGSVTSGGAALHIIANTFYVSRFVSFKIPKRTNTPVITIYSTNNANTSGVFSEYSTADAFIANRTIGPANFNENGFDPYSNNTSTVGNFARFHWTSESEL